MKSTKNDPKFENLLEFLRQSRRFDFTGYKRPSLMRRVERRMHMIGVKNYDDYADYLEVHPEEFSQVFDSILINVTSFFRDHAAWSYLSAKVVPSLLETKGPEDPIRVWSAGCATGQESYTAAMVLSEAVGKEAFRERVKIYATDIDKEALAVARQGRYSAKEMDAVPEELRNKYFEPLNGRFSFRPDLRRSVIFGRHDLIQDAPISRLDLLICRNTLMYFNAETQAKVIDRFHFALNRKGFLFLGKAELLLSHAKLFSPLGMKNRVFSKADSTPAHDRPSPFPLPVDNDARNPVAPDIRLRDAVFEATPMARIIVNAKGALVMATQRARTLFGLIPRDLGRPVQELEICYRPAELRP